VRDEGKRRGESKRKRFIKGLSLFYDPGTRYKNWGKKSDQYKESKLTKRNGILEDKIKRGGKGGKQSDTN